MWIYKQKMIFIFIFTWFTQTLKETLCPFSGSWFCFGKYMFTCFNAQKTHQFSLTWASTTNSNRAASLRLLGRNYAEVWLYSVLSRSDGIKGGTTDEAFQEWTSVFCWTEQLPLMWTFYMHNNIHNIQKERKRHNSSPLKKTLTC